MVKIQTAYWEEQTMKSQIIAVITLLASVASLQADDAMFEMLQTAGQQWVQEGQGPGELQQTLAEQNGEWVDLEGFLHKSDDGRWCVSSQASLKSCCLGSNMEPAALRVFVEGDFDDSQIGQVVEASGRLVVEPRHDKRGRLVQLYRLDNASSSFASGGFPVTSLIVFCVVGAGAAVLITRERRKIGRN